MNNLLEFINKRIVLDDDTKDKIRSISSEKFIKKGSAILQVENYCKHLFFIKKGLVKLCFDTDRDEFIMRFFGENLLFTELESLTSKRPSKYQIIALEDTQYIQISYSSFETLFKENPKMCLFYNKFLTIAHVNMMKRISEMLESDATIRYRNFMNENADIANRIILGDLSRYLGINQVTLSRIRHKK